MLKKVKSKVDRIAWKVLPRVYECPDVFLIIWLGYEFAIKKWR